MEEKNMTGTAENNSAESGSLSGYQMIVGDCGGSYLPLRSEAAYNSYNEIAKLYPGYTVSTKGTITPGSGINGMACYYRYVCFNSMWGWADAAFLK
jgi:hypothetical protein